MVSVMVLTQDWHVIPSILMSTVDAISAEVEEGEGSMTTTSGTSIGTSGGTLEKKNQRKIVILGTYWQRRKNERRNYVGS